MALLDMLKPFQDQIDEMDETLGKIVEGYEDFHKYSKIQIEVQNKRIKHLTYAVAFLFGAVGFLVWKMASLI